MVSQLLTAASLILAFTGATVSAADACARAPYKDLLFLSNYPPAETFCFNNYGQPPVTIRTTVYAKHKRAPATIAPTTTKTTTPATTTPKASTTPGPACDKNCKALSSVTKMASSFLNTLCSCIEPPLTVTRTIHIPNPAPETCIDYQEKQGAGKCDCPFLTRCDKAYVGPIESTLSAKDVQTCRQRCDSSLQCIAYAYDLTSGICTTITSVTGLEDRVGTVSGTRIIYCRDGCVNTPP